MNDNPKTARAARKRVAKRRGRIKIASVSAGVLVTLVVVIAMLLNGSDGIDPAVPAALMETAPTATVGVTLAPTDTPLPTPMVTPTPILEPSPEPVFDEINSEEPAQAVTNVEPDYTVTLNVKDKVTMNVGDTGQIRAKIKPSDSSASLVWKSSNEKVVKVNQIGAVKAVAAGTAEVSLYINDSEEPAATVAIRAEKKSSSKTVWIPKTGKKYHSSKKCSNMKNPRQVALSYAKSHGYGKCSKCW